LPRTGSESSPRHTAGEPGDAVEHNRGPRICKPGRERTADTATRTGYQSDPVGEIESIHPASLPELLAQSRGGPPTSSSLAEEERLRSLLLSTAARDFPDARSSPLRLLVFCAPLTSRFALAIVYKIDDDETAV
jgi:hypothetical protein